MSAYYNEFDSYAAAWLRNLITAGHIADGVVDTRSIEDVCPSDLAEFTQCHFFAGIGVWSHALRAAGWPDDRPIWTGSCPCQPFSAAGKGDAFADERHLWPHFHHLIKERRPAIVLGEQVASSAVDDWIDLVHADMEALGYAFGSVPFPSAGVGAPHIRDRNYWVANAGQEQRGRRAKHVALQPNGASAGRHKVAGDAERCGVTLGLAHAWGVAYRPQIDATSDGKSQADRSADQPGGRGVSSGGLAHANGWNASAERQQRGGQQRRQPEDGGACGVGNAACAASKRDAGRFLGAKAQVDSQGHADGCVAVGSEYAGASLGAELAGPINGFWRDADWLGCRDGKWRPVEPGTFPLAHGAASRLGRLRAYGNAINAEAARVFIEAVMKCQP